MDDCRNRNSRQRRGQEQMQRKLQEPADIVLEHGAKIDAILIVIAGVWGNQEEFEHPGPKAQREASEEGVFGRFFNSCFEPFFPSCGEKQEEGSLGKDRQRDSHYE